METKNTGHKDSKAWENGFKAGSEGKSLSKCPHVSGSIQKNSWYQGHAAGSMQAGQTATIPD